MPQCLYTMSIHAQRMHVSISTLNNNYDLRSCTGQRPRSDHFSCARSLASEFERFVGYITDIGAMYESESVNALYFSVAGAREFCVYYIFLFCFLSSCWAIFIETRMRWVMR